MGRYDDTVAGNDGGCRLGSGIGASCMMEAGEVVGGEAGSWAGGGTWVGCIGGMGVVVGARQGSWAGGGVDVGWVVELWDCWCIHLMAANREA